MDVRLRLRDLFDGQRRFEFAQDGCLHCVYLSEFSDAACAEDSSCHERYMMEMNLYYGLAPRKKNSTAFRTRSVSL